MSSLNISKVGQSASNSDAGHNVIDSASSLTRLNYFDGKFLRAPDLQLEQSALLNQIRLSNQSAGGGIVNGFDCVLASGQKIAISAGLGYDWQGRALVLSQDIEIGINTLLTQAATTSISSELKSEVRSSDFKTCEIRAADSGSNNVLSKQELYLIVVNHLEAFCGEEDVYGKLCSEACISSTQRTHIVEGINIRAVPFALTEPLKDSTQVTMAQKHLRSRTVSAYFEQEKNTISSLISQQGLNAATWCLGAEALSGEGIAIGMLSKVGETVVFLDAWGVRRERIVPPPQQYWAARMGMRNWQIYLAQILQFQCHLRDCLGKFDPLDPPLTSDPCADEKALIKTAAVDMQQLLSYYTDVSAKLTQIERLPQASKESQVNIATLDVEALRASIDRLQAVGSSRVSQQLLIDCGIVELPSAGYLPVVADSSISINQQVRQLMGRGVDLRFCAVRADYVHHALEEAQHMQRICLLSGLDNQANIQEVDILVPEGQLSQSEKPVKQPGFQAHLDSTDAMLGMMLHLVADAFKDSLDKNSIRDEMVMRSASMGRNVNVSAVNVSAGKLDFGKDMTGAARAENQNGNLGFYLATENSASTSVEGQTIKTDINLWGQMQSNQDVFALSAGGRAQVSARFLMEASLLYSGNDRDIALDTIVELNISGQLIIEKVTPREGTTKLFGRFVGDSILQYTTTQNGVPKTQVSSASLNDDIVLSRQLTEQGSAIEISIPSPSLFGNSDLVDMTYTQAWNAAGECEVVGQLTTLVEGKPQQRNFLSGKFIPDDNALSPGNPFYNKSLVALKQIAGALNNQGFVETASHLLFPPPVSVPSELIVKGQYPWVLFHRRRSKVCEGATIPDVNLASRKYQIYLLELTADVDLDKIFASLERGFESTVANAKSIVEVEFSASSAAINSAHNSLQQAWRSAVGSNAQVVIAAIASGGDVVNEGDALATSRVNSTNAVLDDVSDFKTELPIVVKQTLPTGMSAQGRDGVIVYFAQQQQDQVETDCHAVYQVLTSDPDAIPRRISDAVAKYQPGSTNVTLDDVFNSDIARKLDVKPMFKSKTGDFTSEQQVSNVKKVWEEAGNYLITHAGAFHPQEDTTSAQVTLKQTESIVDVLGMLADKPEDNMATFAIPGGMLGECQKATVLVSATQCHEVFLVASSALDIELIPGEQVNEAESAALDLILAEADSGVGRNQAAYYRLNALQYYWDSIKVEAGSQQLFVNNWQAHLSQNVALQEMLNSASAISVYSSVKPSLGEDGSPEHIPNADNAKAQNEVLAELMSLGDATNHFALASKRTSFPSNCAVISFVILTPGQIIGAIPGDLAKIVRFDDNNEVVKDEKFNAAVKELIEKETQIKTIELVSKDGSDAAVKVADTQARALKKVLQAEGLATRMATINARAPTSVEKNMENKLFLTRK
ncbi:hypothetical protein [Aliiglaciecola lipolytica]|uniref:Uncharacterized protein n=1 Tax=Aliiglaciecola lipolytica E3 TaxID=1127673 RepID=K6XMY2_9ALTE|nr:hypothetical protein [Aliiglaciecola lipolytica]GAC13041.1 hypothetical protein GLIP_0394 [Aliiglaciecola lipolytica E3]